MPMHYKVGTDRVNLRWTLGRAVAKVEKHKLAWSQCG